jgi:hypothetical protein
MQPSLPAEATDRNIKAADIADSVEVAKIVEIAAQSATPPECRKLMLERELSPVLGPIDDVEHQPTLEHVGFEIKPARDNCGSVSVQTGAR